VLEKIKKARAYAVSIGKGDMDIEIDGGVTEGNVQEIRSAGANVIVAGSAVFKAEDMTATIAKLKA
jgi:ribulose-phosphate 3-epimerase